MFQNLFKKTKLPFLFWFLILFYILILLIGPRIPFEKQNEYCVRNFELNTLFGHSMNCDSADWMLNTSDPSRLYAIDSIRQTRPGMVYTTYFISKFLVFFSNNPNYPKISNYISEDGKNISLYEEFHPKIVYLSYLLFNVIVLFLCIYFFFKIFGMSIYHRESYQNWYMWFSTFIISNNTVNQFMYSPSTKLLNIFCAVTTIYMIKIFLEEKISKFFFFLIYLLLGFLMLFYASFFISFVILTLLILFGYKKINLSWKIVYLSIYTITFLIPYFTWFLYIQNLNNSFYISNFENYKFIIWLYDHYIYNGLSSTLSTILNSYLIFLTKFALEHFLLLIFLPLLFLNKSKYIISDDKIYFSVMLFSFLYVSFFVILGHIPSDIVSVLIIPLIITLTYFVKVNYENGLNYSSVKIYFFSSLFVYNIWSLTKFGPYS